MRRARRLVDFTLDNKATILVTWLVLLAFALVGLQKLTVSSDNRVFYSEKNVPFQNLVDFETKYLPNHNISFLLTSKAESDSILKLIQAVTWLSNEVWKIENVIRVDSIANYPTAGKYDEDNFELSTIVEQVCQSPSQCNNTELVETPPQGIDRRLISQDRRSLAVSLTLELDLSDNQQIERIIKDVSLIREDFLETNPAIDIHHTGGIPMMHAFSEAANQDSSVLAPITLATIFALAAVLVGSLRAALFLLIAGASSALLTLGIAGHMGHVINPATSIASILILTLVVTSAMHFVSSYLNDSQLYTSYRATINAVAVNVRPISLATATSIAGFASLSFADAPPIGQLGLMAAVGIFFGSLHIFLLGPIILRFIPSKEKPNASQRIAQRASRLNLTPRQAVASMLAILILALGSLKLSINDDFVGYFDSRFDFRIETDYISENLSGPNHIEIDIISEADKSIFRNEYLKEIRALAEFLRSQPVVSSVFSVVDIFSEVEPLFQISQFEATEDELAQFYLALQLSLRDGQSATDYISGDETSSRISVILGNSDSTSIRNLMNDIAKWGEENARSRVLVTGENAPVADLTPTNFREMTAGITVTLLLAAFLIAVTLRSAILAATCLVCTAAPIAIGFGIWGWIYTEMGLASVVVLAVTLGIVIDDAIHIITRFQEIKRADARYSSAVEQTVRIAGGAIVASSIALASGFAILTLSGFGINVAMGACTAIIVLAALIVDLVFLPWLLRALERRAFI